MGHGAPEIISFVTVRCEWGMGSAPLGFKGGFFFDAQPSAAAEPKERSKTAPLTPKGAEPKSVIVLAVTLKCDRGYSDSEPVRVIVAWGTE